LRSGIKTAKPAAGHTRALQRTPSETKAPKTRQRVEARLLELGSSSGSERQAIGDVQHSGDAAAASQTKSLVAEGALAGLRDAQRLIHETDGGVPKARANKARIISRLNASVRSLERVGPDALDAGTKAAIADAAEKLDAQGGGFDLKAFAGRLWALVGGKKVVAVKVPETNAEKLAAHLDQAVAAYKTGDYATVGKLLGDSQFASSLGLSLKKSSAIMHCDPESLTREEIDELVLSIRMSSMSYANGKIECYDAMFIQPSDGDLPNWAGSADLPQIAKLIQPIQLEEWMHQLQRLTGEPISELAKQYIAETGAPQNNEMDIQASFREWGFDVDDLGTVKAYQCRADFEEWYQTKLRAGELS